MKRPCAVNLHNAVTISQDRLGEARRAFELVANERNLRSFALLPLLRRQSHLTQVPMHTAAGAAITSTRPTRPRPSPTQGPSASAH